MKNTILIIDDHEMVLDALSAFLTSNGKNDVSCATDLDHATAIIEAKGAFDLVLVDLRMPGETGTRHIEKLVAMTPNGRVVLMSGLASFADLRAVRAAGVSCFIRKDTSAADTLALVQELLDHPESVPARCEIETVIQVPADLAGLLTIDEFSLLSLVAQGASNASAAQQLSTTRSRVSGTLSEIYSKLGVKTRTQAAHMLIEASY